MASHTAILWPEGYLPPISAAASTVFYAFFLAASSHNAYYVAEKDFANERDAYLCLCGCPAFANFSIFLRKILNKNGYRYINFGDCNSPIWPYGHSVFPLPPFLTTWEGRRNAAVIPLYILICSFNV